MLVSPLSSVSLSNLPGSPISEFSVNTSICMDLERRERGSHRRIRYLDPDRMDQYPGHIESWRANISHHHSSPLPQREWSHSSSSVQPYHRLPSETMHRSISARPTYVPGTSVDDQTSRRSPHYRRRRGRGGSRDSLWWIDQDTEHDHGAINDGLHHLQTSPYNNRLSIYSAPEQLEHYDRRPMTTESSTGYAVLSSPDTPMSFPRSPTYPPARGRRYYNNGRSIDDTSFVDASEFHLFVQATAGLQEEDTFVYPRSDPNLSSSQERQRIPPQRPSHDEISTDLNSPVDEASMTICALRHLAQMPDGSPDLFQSLTVPSQPSQPPTLVAPISPEELEDFDDELPDYEESQAQAWSHRRVEAARRAQELQRRWQQTGARRGPRCYSDLQ